MSKSLLAEYDAKRQALMLPEPLAGVRDREKVQVLIQEPGPRAERPWTRLRGILSPEAGEQLARQIEKVFGPINA